MATSYHTTAYNVQPSTADLLDQIRRQRDIIARLSYNPTLAMYRPAGLLEAIANLPADATYTVVLCDIDRMKAINSATGSHAQTDRYLAAGLRVRAGELAGQVHDKGDEFAFILTERSEHGRREEYSPEAFVARIARQLAGQPLTSSERHALAAAQGVPVEQAKLSATFSTISHVKAGDIEQAIEWLSNDVLALKAQRDSKVTA